MTDAMATGGNRVMPSGEKEIHEAATTNSKGIQLNDRVQRDGRLSQA